MRTFRIAVYSLLGLALLSGLTLTAVLLHFSSDLPSLDALKNYLPRVVTTVYSAEDKVIAEFSKEKRKTLPPGEMPENVVNAFVAAEDAEFFSHRGINPVTIFRAFVRNTMAGQTVQGGSTITQQVAKSILLSPERTYKRKIREVLLAFKIEKALSKSEILNLYLNHIYLGENAYGIQAASEVYFGKDAKDLTIPEAAILGGLPRAPGRDNPIEDPPAAKQRQLYVLKRLYDTRKISTKDYEDFKFQHVQIKNRGQLSKSEVPYFTEHVRRAMLEKYGEEKFYTSGLKIYTTMNLADQIAAQDSIKAGLIALDKRIGLRQPELHLKTEADRSQFLDKEHKNLVEDHFDFKNLTAKGDLEVPFDMNEPTPLERGKNYRAVIVRKDKVAKQNILTVQVGNRVGSVKPDDYKWVFDANREETYKEKVVRNPFTELKIGDVITVQLKQLSATKEGNEFFLEQEPLVQGALLSYRFPDGAVLAMVGGYDYYVTKSQYNRAVQAKRQPGSAFKPFIFSAALDAGLTPSTVVVDSPIVYRNNDEKTQMEKTWKPDNFGDRSYGDTSLRNALAFSRNIPTIKLLQHLGLDQVVDYVKKLGVQSPINQDLSMALGSSAITLEELLRGWSVFANKGQRLQSYFIRKVEDRDGAVLEEHQQPAPETMIPESTAFLMTSMLKSVVDYGTGTAAKELGRPVAGKTGTTNDSKDALFVGYVPQAIAGVWVGFDKNLPLGRNEVGGRAAAPIWLQYMQTAVATLEPLDFEPPASVVQLQVDGETGDVPTAATTKRVWEYFAVGTAPGQPAGTVGPDGQLSYNANQVNKTKTITGNMAAGPSTEATKGAQDNLNADELLRNEL
jgi:penicillin-binding protein 1A